MLTRQCPLACCIVAASLAGWAERSTETPDPDAPLHERIKTLEALILANHWNDGLILPNVIFPPAGEERPVTGNHEDVAAHTAFYLAACSFEYAVMREPAVRERARALMDALLRLEQVTGVPGVVARGMYKTDKPLWHEKAFFFEHEWHDSTTMPGYRWEGDLSSDKFTNFFFAMSIYWELCADEAEKARVAGFLDRFVGRCVDYNFKLVDVDGKMTLWGNFCPDLPHENLNALEMLGGLKATYRITQKARYEAAYRRLIDEYHYDDEAILAKVLWPDEWKTPWDDNLAAQSLYVLMRWETDRDLLIKYRMSLNRHWFDWQKQLGKRGGHVYWFPMLYQVLAGEQVVGEDVQKILRGMGGLARGKRTYVIPVDGVRREVESEWEEASPSVLMGYWFGRHYGIIDPTW